MLTECLRRYNKRLIRVRRRAGRVGRHAQDPGTRTLRADRRESPRRGAVRDLRNRDLPGFGVRVYPSGTRAYGVRGRGEGRSRPSAASRSRPCTMDFARRPAPRTGPFACWPGFSTWLRTRSFVGGAPEPFPFHRGVPGAPARALPLGRGAAAPPKGARGGGRGPERGLPGRGSRPFASSSSPAAGGARSLVFAGSTSTSGRVSRGSRTASRATSAPVPPGGRTAKGSRPRRPRGRTRRTNHPPFQFRAPRFPASFAFGTLTAAAGRDPGVGSTVNKVLIKNNIADVRI